MSLQGQSVDELLQAALSQAQENLQTADRLFFFLQEGRQLKLKASLGRTPPDKLLADRVSRAILRRVRRTGRTLFLSDALADHGLGVRQSIREIGQRSVICAPLKAQDKVVGLVYADTVSMIAAFTPEQLAWLNGLVSRLDQRLGPLLPEYLEAIEEEPLEDEELPRIGVAPPKPMALKGSKAFDSLVGAALERRAPHEPATAFQVRAAWETPKGEGEAEASSPSAKLTPDELDRWRARRRSRALGAGPRVKPIDRALFFRSMAVMLTAGLPIHRVFDVLAQQSRSLGAVAQRLSADVTGGRRLSTAMGRFPKVFGTVERAIVAVGEETGNLDVLLESLAQHEERLLAMRGRIQSAFAYPLFVFVFCLGGCVAAPPLFLNDLFQTLTESQIELPLLTHWVMGAARVLSSAWFWLMALGIVGAAWAFRASLKVSSGLARTIEDLLYRLPALGPLMVALSVLGFVRSLAVLLDAGVRLDRSLELAAEASGSRGLGAQIRSVVQDLHAGSRFSKALAECGLFPRTFIEFMALGEETGRMVEACGFAERLYREQVERDLETLEALMEPLAVCFVGILVGLIAIACLLPLVRMVEGFM